jgi:hypothetical protein
MKDRMICCMNCKEYIEDKNYPGTGWCKHKIGVRLNEDCPCKKFVYKYAKKN